MIDTKLFYERNDCVLNSHINCTYEELVEMTPDEFRDWVIEMRKVVKESWDAHGCPPRTGKTEEGIIDQFNKIAEYPTHEFTHTDELSDVDDDVIINKSRMGGEADQWFSNMMKVRINYTEKDTGYSIYDLFADDKHLEKMVKGGMRHFRRDSLYEHAKSAFTNSKKYAIINTADANHWMETFFTAKHIFKGYDFILEEVKVRDGLNSGYFQVEQSEILNLTKDEVKFYKDKGWLEYRHHSTFDIKNMSDDMRYNIRVYKQGRKMFPKAFAAYRIGYIQPAVNFPPMTAKYLYERFTEDIKDQEVINIYDPSAGWGGRILGAMGVRDDRRIHYIGTDPNPDNFVDGGDRSKYESLATFYNTKTYRGNPFFSETNTFDVFQEGSEEIQHHERFQQYRGKLDLIFTSPPYFNREAYSEDGNQSYKKYGSSYEAWREGFLRPTLETCAEYLRTDRYLLWNIADLLISGKYLPLEEDSRKILEECGMEYQYTIKMALEGMPGQNRMGEDGKPTCKNYCQVNGKYLKYEPVFVFKKSELIMNENYQATYSGSSTIPVRLEYVWTDGYYPANLRSKVRYENWDMNVDSGEMSRDGVLERIDDWSFDGSSTLQSETEDSDVILRPVKVYHNPMETNEIASFLVLCDTWNPDGTPHKSNNRHSLEKVMDKVEDTDDVWMAVEQEYTFLDNDNLPVNWNVEKEQGLNYCGVGSNNVSTRFLVDSHANFCLSAGIEISGTNAEVLISQWEYQLNPSGPLEQADDLWMSRYILQRMTEGLDFYASFNPKPIDGEWNGAGAHINFSTEYMRENSDKNYIEDMCEAFAKKHDEHMKCYGTDNEKRLTGDCETQHYDRFSYGISDRGASIRIPPVTSYEWKGYLEDRRPAANIDPYEAFIVMMNTISTVKVPEKLSV